jgi:hypothetical protein
MSNKKNISKAIIQVMSAVKGMEKKSKVGSGYNSYNGTKDQDVKEVFNTEMAKAGLCILPIDVEEETTLSRWSETYNGQEKQKQSVFTKVKTKYLLLHDSGESIELAGYGHGVDSQDKGAGKATTYALKNCLLYTFLTPVGKIDDTETTHSQEIKAPAAPAKPKRSEKPTLTDAAFQKALKKDDDYLRKMLVKCSLTEIQQSIIELKLKIE